MAELTFTPDLSPLDELDLMVTRFIARAQPILRAAGEKALQKEVPRKRGAYAATIRAEITGAGIIEIGTSPFPGKPARSATAVSASGESKGINLSATSAVDLTTILLEGRSAIVPRGKRAILIGVESPPAGEAYILDAGRAYIIRRRAKGTKANRFDLRAEDALLRDLDGLLLEIPLE